MYKIFSKKSANFGFTLIELLVVVAIIGLLSTIVIVSLNNARFKARDAKRIADLREMFNTIIASENGLQATTFTVCTTAGSKVNTCTGTPNLSSFADPGVGTGGTACTNGSTAQCQYSLIEAGSTSQNFTICSYLETGGGVLPSAGPVKMTELGKFEAGCL